MDIAEILKTGGGALVVILTLIEITPLKINPWRMIARWIGKALNADMMDVISENNAKIARYRIIRFYDETRHDVKHTEEHFNQIMDDIRTYEQYCDDHPKFKNNKAVTSIEGVREIYRKCLKENSFL